MSTELQPYQEAIGKSRSQFQKIASQTVNYDKESVFAMQMLMRNDFTMKTANANPTSVHWAMINVASIGLTLNPANAYAYLVPRDGSIVLDISYKGLIKIATDSGSIVWGRAANVYEEDTFIYHGPADKPEHHADPFKKERGAIIGSYCIAKTKEGDILTEVITLDDIHKIRGKSSAFVRGKEGSKGPWEEWFDQMCKKAVIKRASKTWPYTDDRLAQAIEIANTSEGGYDIRSEEEKEAMYLLQHQAAVGRNWRTVDTIKQYLLADDPDAYAIAEIWRELPQEEQILLWRAESKGGCFTTEERKFLKEKLPPKQDALENQQS
jgi:recombination protein RecT